MCVLTVQKMPKNLEDILDGIPQKELEEYLDQRKGKQAEA